MSTCQAPPNSLTPGFFIPYADRMRIENIICPACQHRLRIPEDLMGTPVQCPDCGTEFIAPPPAGGSEGRSAIAQPMEVMPVAGGRAFRDDEDTGYDPRIAAGKIRAPAIGLLICGFGNLAMNAYSAFDAVVRPDEIRKQFQQMQAMMALPAAPMDAARIALFSGVLFGLLGLFQIACGYAMLSRRSYVLSVIGAFLAIATCNAPCCLVNLPVGIWALVILLQADVKASFR